MSLNMICPLLVTHFVQLRTIRSMLLQVLDLLLTRENCTNVRILTHYINREKIQMLMSMKLWVSWKLDLSMLLEKSLHPSLMAMDSAI